MRPFSQECGRNWLYQFDARANSRKNASRWYDTSSNRENSVLVIKIKHSITLTVEVIPYIDQRHFARKTYSLTSGPLGEPAVLFIIEQMRMNFSR